MRKLHMTCIEHYHESPRKCGLGHSPFAIKRGLKLTADCSDTYRARWMFHGIHGMIPNARQGVEASEAPYIKKQLAQLAKHPFRAFVNAAELKSLEAISSGPQYLSEAVIDREKWKRWMFWRSAEAKNKSASDLHHAVRATRYGCQNNGSHAAYSQVAFEILHKSYGNTVWAEATPYWFSCKHFKDGCASTK